MALDYQAIGVGVAGILTAVGAVLTGIRTGRTESAKERLALEAQREQFRNSREAAEDLASRERIEAIRQDAMDARAHMREVEGRYHTDMQARYAEIRALQYDRQRGWDLARHHFELMANLAHIFNGLFMVMENSDFAVAGPPQERVLTSLRRVRERVQALVIPRSLEEPIPDRKE